MRCSVPFMGKFGDFVDKAKDLATEHDDKIDAAAEKLGDLVDDKTGGKYSDKIDTGVEKLQGLVDNDGNPA